LASELGRRHSSVAFLRAGAQSNLTSFTDGGGGGSRAPSRASTRAPGPEDSMNRDDEDKATCFAKVKSISMMLPTTVALLVIAIAVIGQREKADIIQLGNRLGLTFTEMR
jgi:hypothetical protein